MKKKLAAALLFFAAAALFLMPRPDGAPDAPTAKNSGPAPPGGLPTPVVAVPDTFAPSVPSDRAALRELASDWRRKARGDSGFRARLRGLVLDGAAASESRELAALVLGTIPDREGLDVLAEALDAARDPRWLRTLLLALGSDRTSGEDDDVFDLPDSPRVYGAPLGLAILIRGAIEDPALRDGMIPRIRAGEDPGVRWAAVLALSNSMSFGDVRRSFLEALPAERDPAAEGELSKALADWAAGEPSDSPERMRAVTALLDGAARTEAAALRIRSEEGLKRMTWTSAEVRQFVPRMEGGTMDQRRWAIAVLAGAGARLDLPDRDVVFESLARVAGSESDAKVREFAVSGLAGFLDRPGTGRVLMGRMNDPAWHVRAAAVRAIGRGAATDEIRSALERVERTDADQRVRRAAAEVRRAMGSK